MPTNWNNVKEQVTAFRNHVNALPVASKNTSAYCYLLTKDEIEKLLNQRADGIRLDGIRIYLGAEIVDGQMIPNIQVLACKKDVDGGYNDYKIGDTLPTEANAPLLGQVLPCPINCSKKNILNQ